MTGDTVAHPRVMWRAALTVLVLIATAVGLAQTGAGLTLLRHAGLFEQPVSYTALAFQHPQSLPALTSRRAAVPVSFVISNAGDTARTYQWTLSVVQGTLTRRAAAGSIQLAAGRRAALTQVAHVVCTQKQEQVRLVVSVTRPSPSMPWPRARQSPSRRRDPSSSCQGRSAVPAELSVIICSLNGAVRRRPMPASAGRADHPFPALEVDRRRRRL